LLIKSYQTLLDKWEIGKWGDGEMRGWGGGEMERFEYIYISPELLLVSLVPFSF